MKKFKFRLAKLLKRWAQQLAPEVEIPYTTPIRCREFKVDCVSVAYVASRRNTLCPTEIAYRLCSLLVDSLLEKEAIQFSEEPEPYGGKKYIATVYVRLGSEDQKYSHERKIINLQATTAGSEDKISQLIAIYRKLR